LKTKELINCLGIYSPDLETLERTWGEIYADYRFFSHSDERRILFLRDLMALSKIYSELLWLKKAKLSISVKLISNPIVIYKILKMGIHQAARRNKRKAI
jgi:hypothetical protein